MATIDITNSSNLQDQLLAGDLIPIVRQASTGAEFTWVGLKASAMTGVFIGAWPQNAEIVQNNVVVYQGALFQAITTFTSGTNFDASKFNQLTPYPVLAVDGNGNVVVSSTINLPTSDPKVNGRAYLGANNAICISTGN